MKIVFIRHGKDDDRYRGGWSNLDLIPEGMEQAKKLAKHLKENKSNYEISQIVSSDLPRTMTTASYISEELGLPILKDFQLRETNNGDLAGMMNCEALIKYPGVFFNSLKMNESYPNGESPNDFYMRIRTWFKNFVNKYRKHDSNILVVTHSGVINIIYHIIRNIEWSNKSCLIKIANSSVHVLNVDTMEFEMENKIDFLSN